MFRPTVLAAALAVVFGTSANAYADDRALAQMREEIKQMRQEYEARIRALENRLQGAEREAAQATQTAETATKTATQAKEAAQAPAIASAAPTGPAASANAFNPAISAILGGTWNNLSQDPGKYRLQGFAPSGAEGNARSFNLGESEITLSASIDPNFSGQLTFALTPDDSVEVEEAFFQSKGLSNGLNLKGGRMLSGVGYLNSIHAHAWDFVDAPLAYQAFFGGQYKTDGVQLRWLAPTERFIELGIEAGNGGGFPGNDRNKNGAGAAAVFAHIGDDIGTNASWRAGISYLHTGSVDRSYDDTDSLGNTVTNAFSGHSNLLIADAIYKWAPNGNATRNSFKLQGEYFRRTEGGSLTYDTAAQSAGTADGSYSSAQSGWYLQGIYQFHPLWRVGLRYDKLYAGTPNIGLVNNGSLSTADFPLLSSYNPSRSTLMLDYSPSEFSRIRLQFARDKSRPEATDNQIFLQYIMSLGAHGAHTF